MNLCHMQIGDKAKIIDFSTVNDMLKRRLIDMGINEGCEVCLKDYMPFGGPCLIEAGGQCVSIRRREAKGIKVGS